MTTNFMLKLKKTISLLFLLIYVLINAIEKVQLVNY